MSMRSCESRYVTLLALLSVSLVAAGCGPADEQEKSDHQSPAYQDPQAGSDSVEEEIVAEVEVEAVQESGDPQQGEVLYVQYCSSCHGTRGGADGPVGQALVPKPARHNDGDYMNPLSNEHLFKVIKQGGIAVGKSPLMASWGPTLKDEQIWDVVAFIRTLAEPPYSGPMP
jgi:mono/diheme cytochrome c family protein